jgi:hypothetical protein
MLNVAEAVLDATLAGVLNYAANHLNDNFLRLFEDFERIRDRQRIAAIVASTSGAADGAQSWDRESAAFGGQTAAQQGAPRSATVP